MTLIPLKSANTGKEQYLLLLPMPYFLPCYRFAANPVKVFLYFHICTSKVIMSYGPYWFFLSFKLSSPLFSVFFLAFLDTNRELQLLPSPAHNTPFRNMQLWGKFRNLNAQPVLIQSNLLPAPSVY